MEPKEIEAYHADTKTRRFYSADVTCVLCKGRFNVSNRRRLTILGSCKIRYVCKECKGKL